jgi:hypothetical protein
VRLVVCGLVLAVACTPADIRDFADAGPDAAAPGGDEDAAVDGGAQGPSCLTVCGPSASCVPAEGAASCMCVPGFSPAASGDCAPLLSALSVTPGALLMPLSASETRYDVSVPPAVGRVSWLAQAPSSATLRLGGVELSAGQAVELPAPAAGELELTASAGGAARVYALSVDRSGAERYLKPASPQADGYFGYVVSLEGDRMAVGAPGEDSHGAVYVLERDASGVWKQATRLAAELPGVNGRFGFSVSLSGSRLAVGAKWDPAGGLAAGAAYVFERDAGGTWNEVKLQAPQPMASERFGHHVSLDGDLLAVGAPHSENSGTVVNDRHEGSVYVYRRESGGWVLDERLTASNGDLYDYFGNTVALSGSILYVGAILEDSGGNPVDDSATSSGAVYVLRRSESGDWIEEDYLKAATPRANSFFGHSIAVRGNRVAIGALEEPGPGEVREVGAVYLFDRQESGEHLPIGALKPPGALPAFARFGSSVALDEAGEVLVVGSDETSVRAGQAHVFRYAGGSSWEAMGSLKSSNGEFGDIFGGAVAISQGRVAVGAFREDGQSGAPANNGASASGATYVFE